MKKTESWTVS